MVVGITGQVGSRVAALLARRGARVRGVSRHPHDYTGTGRMELVAADLRDPEEAGRVVEGARAVYLTPPLNAQDALEDQRRVALNVIRAAQKAGVRHLVMHTALKAKEGGTGARVIDEKKTLEEELKASGVPFTILRPGWFLDNLLAERDALQGGTIVMPLPPERRLGVVAARDIARAAVEILARGPQNRGFDLHVRDGVDGAALAQAATRALGQPVVYREASLEAFVHQAGAREADRELQRELYEYLREHDFLGAPTEIRKVVPGFRYTSVRRFMEERLVPAAAAPTAPVPTPWLPTPPEAQAPLPPEEAPPTGPGPWPVPPEQQ